MIDLFKVFMAQQAKHDVATVLDSGYIGEGPKVKLFEEKLKILFDSDYVVTTNSATSAEHLIFHMLCNGYDISKGEEVLCTPLTCTATNWPVLANGLRIKWVDVDPLTLNMDLKDLERKITRTTKIIYLVHWGGCPIDLDEVVKIQNRAQAAFGFRPILIQDCAHAMGATYKNKQLSHYGICTYSFQAIKHITCGDGGALVLNDENLYRKAKLLRWYGIDRENNRKDFRCEANIPDWGFKFHMNDISATIGLANLEHLPSILSRHDDNANFYYQNLINIPKLSLISSPLGSSYWLYTVKVENRDDFMAKMARDKITVSRVHERNDLHTCVAEYRTLLPNLDEVVKEMICIPVGWWVSKEDREYICDKIKEGW